MPGPVSTTIWTSAEETALIDFLVDNKAEAGDGGNFKKVTFPRATAVIAHLLERGLPKTVKSCQNKWASFRKVYRVIRAIQAVSGWVWDNETGASITPETASSWNDYVKSHPDAKPFRNKGWAHLAKVSALIPTTSAVLGTNVFHPAIAQDKAPSSPAPSEPNFASYDVGDQLLEDSDDDKDTSPLQTPMPRKRVREPATPTRPSVKRPRASQAATALQDMSASLAEVGKALSTALAPPVNAIDPTPRHRTNAVSTALQLESGWLDTNQLVDFIDFLRGDQTGADVYLALTESNVRKDWVQAQLAKRGSI